MDLIKFIGHMAVGTFLFLLSSLLIFVFFLLMLFGLDQAFRKTANAAVTATGTHRGPLKVAIIDTGINLQKFRGPLCQGLSRDFTGTGLQDDNGHGTMMAQIVADEAGPASYCLIIVKYYGGSNMVNYIKALQYVASLDVDFVNLSLAGTTPSTQETALLRNMLNRGVQIVTVAGNEGRNLDTECNVYPACSDFRLTVVGSHNSGSSNTGHIVDLNGPGVWLTEKGEERGTSIAAAYTTGRLVHKFSQQRSK